MNQVDALEKLVNAIAGGAAIDWQEEKNKHPEFLDEIVELEKVEKLMLAFHSIGDEEILQIQEGSGGTEKDREPSLFQWGHLKVVEKIGEGAFGEVFRAYDSILDRNIALKLQSSKSRLHVSASRYIREARHLARVRHPNVLAVHGADRHDGRAGLWCDLLSGHNLEDKLGSEGVLQQDTSITIAQALCRALACVHDAGLVHGDVKPSNVMEEPDGRIVLMDFGAGILSKTTAVDEEKNVTGTPLFLAPETLSGTRPSAASDVFALGVLLFRMMTGSYPVEGDTIPQLMWHHQERKMVHLDRLCAVTQKPYSDLILSMLHPNPQKRPGPSEILKRLEWIREIPARRKNAACFH